MQVQGQSGVLGRLALIGATLSVVVAVLAGCAAASVALSKKDLDVQAKTSTAIFIEPVARDKRTIYVDVRSGVQEFDRRAFSKFVKQQFAQNENGYQIVDDPTTAHFQMLVYVLNLEKASPTAAQAALQQGYSSGDLAAGAAAGALIGSGGNGYGRGAFGGAMAGGLVAGGASLIADNLVHDVTYMLVCDIAVKEQVAKGVFVRKDTAINAKVSDSGTSRQTVSEVSNNKEYRTRIVTTANKVNLELPEAQDQMFNKTAYAMAGFF